MGDFDVWLCRDDMGDLASSTEQETRVLLIVSPLPQQRREELAEE